MENYHCDAFKRIPTAILLSFFLGPFGLLYSHYWFGVGITIVGLCALFIPNNMIGLILLFTCWLVCPFIAVFFANRYNQQLRDQLHHSQLK